LANAEAFLEPLSSAAFVDPFDSEKVPITTIRRPEVQIFVGIDDDVCPPAQAKQLYDGLISLTEANRSLNIIEFVDPKDKDGAKMGHNEWTDELSLGLLNQMIRAIEEGASNL
jgi:hypothetical protein